MAYNATGLTDYVEQNNLPLISEAIVGGEFMEEFNIQTGIKATSSLNYLDVDVTLQDGSACGFNALGGDTFTQRDITVTPLKVNKTWCPKDLTAKWMGYTVKTAANGQELPFEQYLLGEVNKKVQSLIGFNLWQGDTATSGATYSDFDGVLTITGTTTLTGVTSGMSVYDATLYVYNNIPANVIDNAVIYMGKDSYRTFIQDILAKNLFQVDSQEGDFIYVLPATNIRVKGINYLNGTKKIVATDPKNIYIGTDMEGDYEAYDLFWSQDDRLYKLVIEFKAGVQIAFPDEFIKTTHN